MLTVHSAVSTVKLTGKRQMGSRACYSWVDPFYEDGKCAKTQKLLHALGSDASKGAHLIKGHRLQGVCSSKAGRFAASARGIIGQGSQKDPETLTRLRCGWHGHLYRGKNSPGALWDSNDPHPHPMPGTEWSKWGYFTLSPGRSNILDGPCITKKSSNPKEFKCWSLAGGGSSLRTTVSWSQVKSTAFPTLFQCGE